MSPIFTKPADCADAYYAAFKQGNADVMMNLWAEDEEIICIHPAAAPLHGYNAVRTSWVAIFGGLQAQQLEIERKNEHWIETVAMAVQSLLEWVKVKHNDEIRRVPVSVINTYLRTPSGWRLLSHHASPVHGMFAADGDTIVEGAMDSRRVLH
jgi:ketosteroid isomerase-like protein